jgi:hypothetical protein
MSVYDIINIFPTKYLEKTNGRYPQTSYKIIANGDCFFHAFGYANDNIYMLYPQTIPRDKFVNYSCLTQNLLSLRKQIATKEIELKHQYNIDHPEVKMKLLIGDEHPITYNTFITPDKHNQFVYTETDIIYTSVIYSKKIIFILNCSINEQLEKYTIDNYEIFAPNFMEANKDNVIFLINIGEHFETFYDKPLRPTDEFIRKINIHINDVPNYIEPIGHTTDVFTRHIKILRITEDVLPVNPRKVARKPKPKSVNNEELLSYQVLLEEAITNHNDKDIKYLLQQIQDINKRRNLGASHLGTSLNGPTKKKSPPKVNSTTSKSSPLKPKRAPKPTTSRRKLQSNLNKILIELDKPYNQRNNMGRAIHNSLVTEKARIESELLKPAWK